MYSPAEFKKGLKIELDGVPYTIVDFQHVKPGKGGAFVRTKMKSLLTGRVLDQTSGQARKSSGRTSWSGRCSISTGRAGTSI